MHAAEVPFVWLGLLSSLYYTKDNGYARTPHGYNELAAIHFALDHINNKSDGLGDELLPHTQLKFVLADTKDDEALAFQSVTPLAQPPSSSHFLPLHV